MKLSEIKGTQAIEVIADIIEPATEILSDPDVMSIAKAQNIAAAASVALKKHPKAVLKVLAALDGEDPETYQPTLLSIPAKVLEIVNDPELLSLFTSSDQTEAAESSGPQSGNTEDR